MKNSCSGSQKAKHIVLKAGLAPTAIHAANTSAAIFTRESWYSMVRPGLALFGYYLPFSGRDAK